MINLLIQNKGNINFENDAGEKPVDYVSTEFLDKVNSNKQLILKGSKKLAKKLTMNYMK